MKSILQIVLWIGCIVLGYFIYSSINAPIKFNKVREERFSAIIDNLKDIRDSQEAYKAVNGKYTSDFNSLIKFIDTGSYTITQQRDTSFLYYDKSFQIDLQKDSILIDTLGFVKVKDSLFKGDNRYKKMMNVPYAKNGEKFKLAAEIKDNKGYSSPVFEASVLKNVVLYDQPKDLVEKENAHNSVEEINDSIIKVGSLDAVSTNGNWPAIYDRKKN